MPGYLRLTQELSPDLQWRVRLITRDDLPATRFYIKYGGASPWFQAECEPESPYGLVITVLDSSYTSRP
jgi:hypothetical protein